MSKHPFKDNKSEIVYNLINAGIAGSLVFLGALSSGEISFQGFLIACIASGLVMVNKFKDYWVTQETEYSNKKKVLTFI